MNAEGLDPARLEFVGFQPLAKYYDQHARIDIALDPFPYGGGTTTCESLWSGAPVVSLAGRTAVSRAGLSILSNVGLPELVAHSTDQYLDIATTLARDLPRLTELRAGMRKRMQASPLMDGPRFARDIESLYRQAWRNWCEAGAESK
jgi:predicted O-linked N-acetylglucosamine transferase (SPINDLY family)